jgi:predicted RNA-binding Zn-ribbon protein involved in translation (DUF1610 family)
MPPTCIADGMEMVFDDRIRDWVCPNCGESKSVQDFKAKHPDDHA